LLALTVKTPLAELMDATLGTSRFSRMVRLGRNEFSFLFDMGGLARSQ
jgi:hypothetical protein